MTQNQIDLPIAEKRDEETNLQEGQDKNKKNKSNSQEGEGSLQSIEKPLEKNTYEILKTEEEIEKEDKQKENSDLDSNTKNAQQKHVSMAPLSLLFHFQANKAKYVF